MTENAFTVQLLDLLSLSGKPSISEEGSTELASKLVIGDFCYLQPDPTVENGRSIFRFVRYTPGLCFQIIQGERKCFFVELMI